MTVRLPLEVARKKRGRRVEEVVERRKKGGNSHKGREIAKCAGDWRANWEVKGRQDHEKNHSTRGWRQQFSH